MYNAGCDEDKLIDNTDDVEHRFHPTPSEEVGTRLRAIMFVDSKMDFVLVLCLTEATPSDFRR